MIARGPPRPHRTLVLLLAAVIITPTGVLVAAHGASIVRSAYWSSWTASPGRSVVIAPAFAPGPGTTALGPLPGPTTLEVAVGVAGRDPVGLASFDTLASTPGTSEYRQYLSPASFVERFAASPTDYAAAAAYFLHRGLGVVESPDRTLLLVRGPAGLLGPAFGTSFTEYRSEGRVFFSHASPATLPQTVPWTGVLGLGNATPLTPYVHRLPDLAAPGPAASCPVSFGYSPCNITRAYNYDGLISAGTNGSGVRVGVVDAYDSTENQSTLAADLTQFVTHNQLHLGSVNYLYPVPTPKDLNKSASTGWALEEALDIEWNRAMAPGATIDFTFGPDAGAGLYASVDWLVAHHAVDVLSLSWGEPDVGVYNAYSTACSSACNASSDGSYTLLSQVLAEAAAEGITVVSASGDCGAAEGTSGLSTSYPSSDPMVTGVGGTDLALAGSGAYSNEVGWSGNASGASSPGCQNQGGSGGGFSPYPRPAWQSAPGFPGTRTVRGVPDVAIAQNGISISYQGSFTAVAGTSASTPMWAGLFAIADQKAGAPLGFLNPSLYAVARSSAYHTAFHDVTSGNNGYAAGGGWDPVTGLGSPNASALVPLLAKAWSAPAPFPVELLASPRYAYAGATVTFFANATGGAPPYALTDIDFGDGNATSSPSGRANHTYPAAGVYIARAVVYDSAANSSVSAPVVVVIGGGGGFGVTLTPSNSTPAVGASVSFTSSVRGGTAPYVYTYLYGDGTYWSNTTSSTASRAYPTAGAYCAYVVVRDSSVPVRGDVSPGVPISVGGGGLGACPSYPSVTVTASSAVVAADLPGDFPVQVTTGGGVGPITTHLLTNNLYSRLCSCGIFKEDYGTIGPHTITVYANDSFHESTTTTLNVTVYPQILASFALSTLSGVAPLQVNATSIITGGHLLDPNRTSWTWGDGTQSIGINASHTFSTPGFYSVTGGIFDRGFGNSSEAFLVDVLPSSGTPGLGATATVLPAVSTLAGYPMQFNAAGLGGVAPYTYRWSLGQNDSALGGGVQQTFTRTGCVGIGTCPLLVNLTVVDSKGSTVNATIHLQPLVGMRWSALVLREHLSGTGGLTPYLLNASDLAAGVPGIRTLWAWGDGNSSVGATASHVYLIPGNYTVTETTRDSGADTITRSHVVVVTGRAIVAPTVTGGPKQSWGIAPSTIVFAVNGTGGSGGPYSFNWTFGDGAGATGPLVSHVYLRAGTYLANVTVVDSIGAPRVVSFPIDIYNVTPVTVRVTAELNSAGTLVVAGLNVTPQCGASSVPTCSPSDVVLNGSYTSAGGSPPPANVSLGPFAVGPAGNGTFDLAPPPGSWSYRVQFQALGPNYTGSGSAAVPPIPSSRPTGSHPSGTSVVGEVVILASVAGAAAIGIVAWLQRRRKINP